MIASEISASFQLKIEQHHGHRDHGDRVLEEEDQAVAEEEAHALQVDGRARHQLAGLVAVVEAEREAHQMRVEAVPHVHLDRQRLAAGEQAAAGHQPGACEPDREHGADEDPEHLVVVRGERLVDHARRSARSARSRRPGKGRRAGSRRSARACRGAGSPVAGRTCGDSEGPPAPSKSSDPPGCDGFARARGGSAARRRECVPCSPRRSSTRSPRTGAGAGPRRRRRTGTPCRCSPGGS